MANIRSAQKRARQSEERRQRNKARRTRMRTSIKRVLKAVKSGDREQAQQAYQDAVRVIDRTANRGIIHKNKAARHKSRLNAKIRSLAG